MKVLVTGGRGQLGSQIHSIIDRGKSDLGKNNDRFKESEFLFIDYRDLDIADLQSVKNYIGGYKPDIVINCAAYTNVDKCEIDRDAAFKANALGPRNIAIACENLGAKLVHISTDYVFDGKGHIPFKEYDVPHPVSVYGKTKLLGEEYVRNFCSRYFIIRTAWLYGEYGKNFVKTIINAAREKGKLNVVNDQIGSPTYAEDLSYHILKLALTDEYGIYHCTGNGECSWFDFACKIVEYSGIDCAVAPITSDKLNRAAKRPSYSSLDNMMLRCTIGDEMREWEEALKQYIQLTMGKDKVNS